MEDMMTESTAVKQPETTDSFLDGWDGADEQPTDQLEAETAPEETPAEEPDEAAEQPAEDVTADGTDTPAQEPQTEQQTGGADQPRTWELRHLDEVRTVNEADMVTLAQKGMDYDRVRSQYDEFKPVMEMFSQFANKQGMNTKEYIALIRAQAKQADGLNEADARRAVELEDREAAVAAVEAERQAQQAAADRAEQARAAAESRRQADIEEFRKTFPEAAKDPKSIPQQVWDAVRGGSSLVSAYAQFAVQQAQQDAASARREAASAQQNRTNAERSTGSMKSAGSGLKARDAFLEGWDD